MIELSKKLVVMMRGLPGSGKSYYVNSLIKQAQQRKMTFEVASTDEFFITGRGYVFRPKLLKRAHEWNQNRFLEYIIESKDDVVIVDNTNTTFKEMDFYIFYALKADYCIRFIIPDTKWAFDVKECAVRNKHAVPRSSIQRMHDRFEKNYDIVDQCIDKYNGLISIVDYNEDSIMSLGL